MTKSPKVFLTLLNDIKYYLEISSNLSGLLRILQYQNLFRLGNPYASNRTDVLLFRVVPSHSSPFVKPEAAFTVVTNTSSEDVGSDLDRTHQLKVIQMRPSLCHTASKLINRPSYKPSRVARP